ncbi:MAG: hypothetical protein IT210_22385 [Armatimonadetes bacterium]|nr:hypothetical protein [Armatimonadota bacterium]
MKRAVIILALGLLWVSLLPIHAATNKLLDLTQSSGLTYRWTDEVYVQAQKSHFLELVYEYQVNGGQAVELYNYFTSPPDNGPRTWTFTNYLDFPNSGTTYECWTIASGTSEYPINPPVWSVQSNHKFASP